MSTLTVRGKSLGTRRPLFADWSILFPPEWSGERRLTLRDLIGHVGGIKGTGPYYREDCADWKVPVASFRGLPRGRRVDPKSSDAAVAATQHSLP
jgi:hypothetical protein